jgi:hypothetical protein
MSKGSGRRPLKVSAEEFSNNWDAIFGKKNNTGTDKFDSLTDSEVEKETRANLETQEAKAASKNGNH